MKYDLGSDLHVDINARYGISIPKFAELKNEGSDALVLAGDLANNAVTAVKILEIAAMAYEHVIYVDGNHEHYNNLDSGNTVASTMQHISDLVKDNPKITYLDGNTCATFGDVKFIGANAWYDFKLSPIQYNPQQVKQNWSRCMNDARYAVFDIQPEEYAINHAYALTEQVIEAQDDDAIEKLVVVTHTVSSPKGLTIKGYPSWDMLNGAFGSASMAGVFAADLNKKIIHAVCGHTHYPFDFEDYDGIRFVINPYGYYGIEGEAIDWQLIQLDTSDIRAE